MNTILLTIIAATLLVHLIVDFTKDFPSDEKILNGISVILVTFVILVSIVLFYVATFVNSFLGL